MHLDLDLIFFCFRCQPGTDVSVIWRSRAYPSFFVYLFVLALPEQWSEIFQEVFKCQLNLLINFFNPL